MGFVIAVDGPSGAGKGTLCRLLAQETGFPLLDSGALYRLTALAAVNQQVDLGNEDLVAIIASQLDIEFALKEDTVSVFLSGEDVTKAIRKEAIGMVASQVAAYSGVRAALLDRQRSFAANGGLIADGRDMGTVVFPLAPVKIFLTASAQERANRRLLQLQDGNSEADYQKILADIESRDKRDRERVNSPLIPAADALRLDSSTMTISEVFDVALAAVRKFQLKSEL